MRLSKLSQYFNGWIVWENNIKPWHKRRLTVRETLISTLHVLKSKSWARGGRDKTFQIFPQGEGGRGEEGKERNKCIWKLPTHWVKGL